VSIRDNTPGVFELPFENANKPSEPFLGTRRGRSDAQRDVEFARRNMLPKILALVMIVATMFSAGLQIDLDRLRATLKNYRLLLRALILNFVVLPAVGLLLVRLFHIQGPVATGILLMSMAPGVPFLVNSAGRKQGGSLSFVLEIAFLFSAFSVVTIPITAELLLPADTIAAFPAQKFLTTLLAFQLLPLIAGALLAPRLTAGVIEKAVRILHVVFLVAVAALAILVFGKVVSSVTAVYGYGQLLVIALIGVFALAAGWLLGGPNREYRRTLSIATLMRNIGLCTLIGSSAAFVGTLVVPTIMAYFVVTFVLSIPVRVVLARTTAKAAAAA
jgi:BASS family bile acid:Na+ symporter